MVSMHFPFSVNQRKMKMFFFVISSFEKCWEGTNTLLSSLQNKESKDKLQDQ